MQLGPASACVCTTRPSTSTSSARSPLPRSASATETGTTPLCVAPSVVSGPVGAAVNSGTWSSRSVMSERWSWNCADGETAAHSVQVHPIWSLSALTPLTLATHELVLRVAEVVPRGAGAAAAEADVALELAVRADLVEAPVEPGVGRDPHAAVERVGRDLRVRRRGVEELRGVDVEVAHGGQVHPEVAARAGGPGRHRGAVAAPQPLRRRRHGAAGRLAGVHRVRARVGRRRHEARPRRRGPRRRAGGTGGDGASPRDRAPPGRTRIGFRRSPKRRFPSGARGTPHHEPDTPPAGGDRGALPGFRPRADKVSRRELGPDTLAVPWAGEPDR